jgi:cytochrome b6-f complex iron-sulfur subunit
MKIHQSCVERRRFLGTMIGGGAAALGAGMAAPLASYVGNFREEPPPEFLVFNRADYELEPNQSVIVPYGPIPVLLFRTPEGELRSFVAICTHFDCTVSYLPGEERIFCACHEGYYDLEGNVLAGPPPRPLDPAYWKLTDDKLILALERENLEKALEQE